VSGGHQQQYDALIFFTYLYATTVTGLEVSPSRSVLVPTAHDEPAIRLEIFKDVFSRPAALLYNTESERRFVHEQFAERPLLEDVVGVGVDIPQHHPYPRMPEPVEDDPVENRPAADEDPQAPGETMQGADESAQPARDFPPHLLSRGAVFRRRHRLYGPIVLYGGRIDPGKGCEELIEYFSSYVKEGGEGTLTLMGVKLMALPEEPFIRFAGLLSDRERLAALEAATVVAVPSPYESLSLLALEAFAVGTPILVNARSEVLVEHCLRSNAGLFYADRDEFVECLTLLMRDGRLRAALGRNGRDYVRRNYRWDVVLGKYERIFAKIRSAQ
jgi:glycosyltransferase involved in cell wall biosynthesis